ncbi:hypothetical protein [Reyranella sp.]|uniref:hypothetical protein n=1 Tax=Reyranella sp. TaxID=1929291 RepID=UPI003D1446C8
MPLSIVKAMPVELRSLGLDERWLQNQIEADPSLLGLGNLEIAGREHRQPVGGRIDFLLRDAEAQTFYEVEIMLGALDESHIIRTIEYWDIERQRRPQWEHRAVIVAEHITSRFFNVLRLLNRSVPLVAVKLSAFQMDGKVIVHPVTVLDVIEESSDQDVLDPVERVDRTYWERIHPTGVLTVTDKIDSALRSKSIQPSLTYNRNHIALGTTGRNFCWLHPRKSGNAFINLRLSQEARDETLSYLENSKIDASAGDAEYIKFSISPADLDRHIDAIMTALLRAEEASR